jgi:hypothetical protein
MREGPKGIFTPFIFPFRRARPTPSTEPTTNPRNKLTAARPGPYQPATAPSVRRTSLMPRPGQKRDHKQPRRRNQRARRNGLHKSSGNDRTVEVYSRAAIETRTAWPVSQGVLHCLTSR